MSDKPFDSPPTPTPAPKLNLAPMPSTSTVGLPAKTLKSKSEWNTKNLGMRLGADFVSAATAASMVAPVISIVDRLAILQYK